MKGLLSTEKIVGLYIQGCGCSDISNIDGRSETTIYNILKDTNTEFRSRSEANKLFTDDVLIHLYNLGLSCAQIGKILDIHATTIVKRFKLINFPMRSKEIAARISYSDDEFNKIITHPDLFKISLNIAPVLIGKFDDNTSSVNINVCEKGKDLSPFENICFKILGTSRWGWPINNVIGNADWYKMTSNNGQVFEGGKKWLHHQVQ
ncbi:MAG: hypothetical protein ACW99A_18615 [Candidatus Kariarchaeaceae archaeon]|jgi:hypothetical protein